MVGVFRKPANGTGQGGLRALLKAVRIQKLWQLDIKCKYSSCEGIN